MLKHNLYPCKLVETLIKKTQEKVSKQCMDKKSSDKAGKPIVAVPYVKGLFEGLKLACRDEVILVERQSTPKMLQSNLVYEVICSCMRFLPFWNHKNNG